ncbi:hypothetical protein [Nonomuraea helvata]|uniref:Uncharacterized protein n=1 Tax=Nonomuraea helvata TaxID=37484 RepID=A0ABV5SJE4_9ACTN
MGVARRRLVLRVARAFLLVVLAMGVYGMHTLGHVHGRHSRPSSDAHGMSVGEEPLLVVPAGLRAFVPEHEMPGLDPTSVCLAILTSFLVMLLMAAWARVGRSTYDGVGGPPPVRQVARPPPKPTSVRLAGLSMLRI